MEVLYMIIVVILIVKRYQKQNDNALDMKVGNNKDLIKKQGVFYTRYNKMIKKWGEPKGVR